MKKCIVLLAAFFMVAALVSAQNEHSTVYKDAPAAVKAQVEKADEFISRRQYQSAFGAVTDKGEYGLAKKVEVCTKYFVKSQMHTMFTLRNLKEGEDLGELRRGNLPESTFSMTYFDVEKQLEELSAKSGMTPVLHFAAGVYYADVLWRYRDQWMKSVDELSTLAMDHLEAALDAGIYDMDSLDTLGSMGNSYGRYATAAKAYEKLTSLDPENPDIHHNYAVSFMYRGLFAEAEDIAKKTVALYEKHDKGSDYHLDSVLLLCDTYSYRKKFAEAEKLLQEAKKDFPSKPRLPLYQGELCLMQGKAKDATPFFLEVLEVQPLDGQNMEILSRIASLYLNYLKPTSLVKFCDEIAKKYKADTYALGYIHFYKAHGEMYSGQEKAASKSLDEAEKHFKQDNNQYMLGSAGQLRGMLKNKSYEVIKE